MHKPRWFRDDQVLVMNARSCGINKDGLDQFAVDPLSGKRTSKIDNQLAELSSRLMDDQRLDGKRLLYVDSEDIWYDHSVVPAYYDLTTLKDMAAFIKARSEEFELMTIGQLVEDNLVYLRFGHGSPSADQRVGDVPYIKVSDLRAGHININPTNLIPRRLAEKYWKGESSGLQAFDLISPERASKNIGEFCVLMPSQEEIVLTKEVIVIRSLSPRISQFYLLWALSLDVVRRQWRRIVFMQTNREDVGERLL